MSRADVIKRIEDGHKIHSIQLLGDSESKAAGFYILMNTQQTISDQKNTFHGIKQSTINLLIEAEIKFKVLKR